MFDSLSGKLQNVLRTLKGEARISEAVLNSTLRELRMALLEADVHVGVVRALLDGVRAKALGQEVLKSLTPGQQVVRIVRDELEQILGGPTPSPLRFASRPPSVFMLVGLQGSGKTTTAAKLGLWLKKAGHYPYLVPADVYRPAAIEQLIRVGKTAGLTVHEPKAGETPLEIADRAALEARNSGYDSVVLDTAGRLHIDAQLMDELRALKGRLAPAEILFVADAMTGQDAVRSAGEFHRAVDLTGVVLTKIDGDSRGGAALSIGHVTGVPLKFLGTGERPSEFEPFHPDRLVGRILGMGDLLGLIEKAEEVFDQEQAAALEKKLRKEQFTLETFRDQIRMVRKMGPLSGIVSLLPGMGNIRESDLDSEAMVRALAVLDSMTPKERGQPQVLNGSRKRRIARGSGQSVQEINRLLKQFAQLRRMMRTLQTAKVRKGGKLPFFGR